MSNNTYTTLPFYVDRDESGVPVIAYDQPNDQLKVSVTGSNTTLDSTTAVLGASGSYTSSQWISVAKYKSIVGSVFADQAGTLTIEQSYDQINADVQSTVNVSANSGQGFEISVVAPYFRLSYTNGATTQTVFRLYTGGKNL